MTLARIFILFGASFAFTELSSHFLLPTEAFSIVPLQSVAYSTNGHHGMCAANNESVETIDQQTTDEVVPTSRFIVQNRFRVKAGREAVFEKRWADRKSRLATLAGFRFFCMMRLVNGNEGERRRTDDADDDEPNYISSTVWDTYENFDVWKKGDAFKEAHGGGTIRGVASMLISAARNTKGKPKPCYWEGILPTSIEGNPPRDGEGWGSVVECDGETTLPADCFVAMNRFSVRPGMGNAFEAQFASRESSLKDYDGFVGFILLRRDGNKQPGDGGEPDDGYTHSTFSVWKNRDAFQVWKSDSTGKSRPKGDGNGGKPNIYIKPPVPSFYEGILALESAPGI